MLFPLLAKHGIGPDQTVVSALMFQHEAGRVYGTKMRNELNRLQAGGRCGRHRAGRRRPRLHRTHPRTHPDRRRLLLQARGPGADRGGARSHRRAVQRQSGQPDGSPGARTLPEDARRLSGSRGGLAPVTLDTVPVLPGLLLGTSRLDVAAAAHSGGHAQLRQDPGIQGDPHRQHRDRHHVFHGQDPAGASIASRVFKARRSRSSASRATSLSAGLPPTTPMAAIGAMAETTLRPASVS